MVFAAPIKGKVLQLLSHHIIYGEIVVPGSEGHLRRHRFVGASLIGARFGYMQ